MSWVDDFYRMTDKTAQPFTLRAVGRVRCPDCAGKLLLRSASLKTDKTQVVWIAECTRTGHWHSHWHQTQRGLVAELTKTFELEDK